jgi:hypothetical protein
VLRRLARGRAPFLYRTGTFPQIVEVFVRGVAGEQAMMALRVSGRSSTRDVAETWNDPPRMGLFKLLSLLLS